MKELPLSKGYVAMVDDEDYELVSRYKWSALVIYSRLDHRILNVYAHRKYGPRPKQRCDLLHRVLLGVSDRSVDVDHKDHNGLNCQRSNLRIATREQNLHNSRKRKNTTSKFKGVTWDARRKKWLAQVKAHGKHFHLGRFALEEQAAEAYNQAASKLFGEFFYADKRS